MQYLPSKKFLVVVLVVLIVLGLGFLASYKSNSNNDNNSSGKFSYISSLFKGNDKDSDNDGLKDWEETLWKTDPKNPDSDGDGTLDGDEVNQGRDPLKPGPDDRLESPKLFSEENFYKETGGLTKTDALARDFFSSFIALYQSGNLNEESKKNLTESFLSNVSQEKLPDKYILSDIKIINDFGNNTLKIYGNNVAMAVNKYQAIVQENEVDIIDRAIKENSETEMQKIIPIIQVYRDISNELLKVVTPKEVSSYHLSLVNGIYNLSESLTKIKDTFKDPINGMIGINQYKNEYMRIKNSLLDISNYFTEKGMVFSKNEEGYAFFIKNR